jgi:hypothetical protein
MSVRKSVSDHVGDDFIQGQVKVVFDVVCNGILRTEGGHKIRYRIQLGSIVLDNQRGWLSHDIPPD